jgi:phage tail protein X
MSTYITKLYDVLDRVVFDRYGSTSNQVVEWVMDQNPGIEWNGIVLPLGITINLPDAPRELTQPPVIPQVFLWK